MDLIYSLFVVVIGLLLMGGILWAMVYLEDKRLRKEAEEELKRIEEESTPEYIAKKRIEKKAREQELNSVISDTIFFTIKKYSNISYRDEHRCTYSGMIRSECTNSECPCSGYTIRIIPVTSYFEKLLLYKDSSIESIMYPYTISFFDRDILNKVEMSAQYVEYSDDISEMKRQMEKHEKNGIDK